VAALAEIPFTSIGIIDDDAGDTEVRKYQIEEVGVQPMVFAEGFKNLSDLAQQVRLANVQGVICDHRLRVRNYAPFNGAQAVAHLFDMGMPAVLISKYTQIDVEANIRPYRSKIPVLLPKDDLDPDALISALNRCRLELAGTIAPSRRARRTLVRIDEIDGELIDAFIPAWNPNEAVRFPLSVIPEQYRSKLKQDDRFFARVNIDAESAGELFFLDFQLAPAVESKDDIF